MTRKKQECTLIKGTKPHTTVGHTLLQFYISEITLVKVTLISVSPSW